MPASNDHHGRTRDVPPIMIRVSADERAQLEAAAARDKIPLSSYVRAAALARAIATASKKARSR